MRLTIKLYFLIILALFSGHAFAAIDPIGWKLNGSFPNPITAGSNYSVIYTFTNNLPLQLINPIVIDKMVTPANEFNYIDTCTGVRLTPQQTCMVQVLMAPVSSGQKSVQLVITGYSSDRVPLPVLTTQTPGTGSISQIVGTVTQSLPGTLVVGSSGNFLFTFTNTGSTPATGVSVQSSVSPINSTCGTSLAAAGQPGSTCTVSGIYSPTSISPSFQTVDAILSYSGGSTTVYTYTSVPTASGVVVSLVGNNYLPAEMVGGSQTIQMLYSNFGPGAVTVTSDPATMVSITTGSADATYTPAVAPGSNSCATNLILNVGAACQSTGTFTAQTETNPTFIAVTGSISFTGGTGSPQAKTTSTTVVNALPTSRMVTFKNNCSFNVWFSTHGGAIANSPTCSCPSGQASCQSICPTGSTCAGSLCYFNNPSPATPGYELLPTQSNSVTFLNPIGNTVWSGNFSASTNCPNISSGTCGQAACGNQGGTANCAVGQGYGQPATEAEITMLTTDADSYDVEVINGMSLPISMAPGPYVNQNNFSCGTPGNNQAIAQQFGACNWTTQATPPSYAYYLVSGITGTAPNCLAGNTCATVGQICGLDATLDPVCGDFLGYWSSDTACGNNATKANQYFNCNYPVANPPGSTLSQFMLCAVPKGYTGPNYSSCYSNYPTGTDTSTCCGCIDWWNNGVPGVNPTSQSCTKSTGLTQTDVAWTGAGNPGVPNVLSQIMWMKTACPTVYVYPFDDASSKFTCTNTLPGSPNSVGYTVTFCPGGDSGLPAGVTEGR
jgi:hypothetical protein